MKTHSLGFIGGGRITKIFLQAFKNKSIRFDSIVIFDTNKNVLEDLKKQFPKIKTVESAILPSQQDIVFIALHPPVIMETLEILKKNLSDKSIIVSLAPKISIEKIKNTLEVTKIARMIPNATSYINEGYNPISFSKEFSKKEKESLWDILLPLGKAFEVDEPKLESYAIISAMLPTYFWFQWQEMQEIGAKIGLNELEAKEAIKETLLASLNIFYNHHLSQKDVIDLIPVKPIADHEPAIKEFLNNKLIALFEKIKP